MLSILLQSGLFLWFILSIFLVGFDTTIDLDLKILGELTNLLMVSFILSNMFNQNKSVLYFTTGLLMLGWYLYYTPQDFIHSGYSGLMHTVYCLIDAATIVYLSASLLWASYSKKERLAIKTQLENITKYKFNIFAYPLF